MKFRIGKGVSNKGWGQVDKSRIWQLLKQGLADGADGVAEAIREVYAVVKADVNKDLTEVDCWGPHHEVRDDGEVVLNRDGLIAAVQALAGARSEPSLTADQKAQARQHLMRHYRELEMLVPGSLAGEMVSLQAAVTGEMRVEDVPLASWADLKALKAGDDDPLEVVVAVPAGKSKRGWNYQPSALQRIVGEVMSQGLPGFLGHQKPENVDHEFPPPVTHWVGAKWENGVAYFRGVVDKAAADLKRWIRAKTIRTVSIFGIPQLQQIAGETNVVDYQPLSIDWTPLGRAGMPTAIVATGEMDEITGGGQKPMTWKELVAQLKTMLLSREVTLGQVVGEMGLKVQEIAGELDAAWLKSVTGAVETVEKVRTALGVTGEMDVVKVAGDNTTTLKKVREVLKVTGEMDVVKVAEEAAKALEAQRAAEHDKVVGEMLASKLTSDAAKKDIANPETALGKLWAYHKAKLTEGMTKDQIAGEIDAFLGDKVVKALLDKLHTDQPPRVAVGGKQENTTLRVKRQSI